ncbi:MAG: hypothetical protein V4679_05935 [Pseudomonadota bacterium]
MAQPRSRATAPWRWLLPLLLATGSASAQTAPDAAQPGLKACSIIVEARAVPGGAALRFHETTGVRFSDTLGNMGHIHGRQVTRWSQDPKGPDLPPEPSLTVQSGTVLTLSEHHFGCTVAVETLDGRTVLKIRQGFSYPGMPTQVKEGVVPLQ